MRIIFRIAALVVVFSLGHAANSSQNDLSQSQSKQDLILIQRIRAGDGTAIAEAGGSGNRLFVPYLREAMKLDSKTVDTAGPARVALARLGETDQLQEEWCRAISGDPKIGFHAPIAELGIVGGWFALQGLQVFLTPEGAEIPFKAAPRQKRVSHVMVDSPTYYALETLPAVVPNPPVQFNSGRQIGQQAKIWQDWIAAHKDELSKLQPTGQGVDFSPNACRKGKPIKKRKE